MGALMKQPIITAKLAIFSFAFLFLASCSSIDINDYSKNSPKLDVREFFNGHLTAHGVLKDRSGHVTRYFNATIDASWDEQGAGTLSEKFLFDDGEEQSRIWKLTPNNDGHYTASANDVLGTSVMNTSGNALILKYVLQVVYKGDVLNLNVDDRMFLVNDNMIINESVMTKFGFKVGEIDLVIVRR